MITLASAATAFLVLHRLISATSLRAILVSRFGEKTYRRLFALCSLAFLIWLCAGHHEAYRSAENRELFVRIQAATWVQWPMQYAALLLILAGLSTRNPTTAGMEDAVHEDAVKGILRVTRHPFLWGVTLMSIAHMLVRGDLASWGLFGTLSLLAVSGTFSIDAKRRRALGADFERFAAVTSNVPFAAALDGRQHISWREIGWCVPAITALALPIVVAAHRLLRGMLAS